MAGSFGFEAGHYDISRAVGEHLLLPRVRSLAPTSLLVADGFSCRTQIEQEATGRRALHAAQVLKLARERGPQALARPYPERLLEGARPKPPRRSRAGLAVAGGALVAAAGTAAVLSR
jgi:hypothetical protein